MTEKLQEFCICGVERDKNNTFGRPGNLICMKCNKKVRED